MRVIVSIILGVLLNVYVLFPSAIVHAQESALGVSPAILEVATEKGERTERQLSITNSSALPLPVQIDVVSLIPADDIINPLKYAQYDASQWISFGSSKALAFEAGETKQVPVFIDVPQIASPGGHYAQIVLRGLSLESTETTPTSIIIPEIRVSVLITVAGEIIEDVVIIGENIFPAFNRPNNQQVSTFTVENRGNVHVLITPEIVLTDKNQNSKSLPMQPFVLLPNTIKQVEHVWRIPEAYGSYRARVDIRYGNDSNTVSSSKEVFVVMPSLFILFTVSFFIVIGLYVLKKRKNIKRAITVLITGSKV